jgi:UDP-GlcNAc3NAcA epimerase
MREERNRVVVDHLSDLRLCPTSTAVRNLEAEGITAGVHHVGDVMWDAAQRARSVVESTPSDLLDRFGVTAGAFSVATVHRAETTDDPDALEAVIAYLRAEAERDAPIVFPVHPRTDDAIRRHGVSTAGLITSPPVGYLDMTRLVLGARRVYTDSGGLQKEAFFHCTPCVTLRSETEWVETVDAGWNRLWTDSEYRPRGELHEYGDGNAGPKIVDVVMAFLG